jgi:PIN domain nuclease of toxin-antitoxin system
MKLLLDTHAFLWFVTGDRRLSKKARRAVEAPPSELLISTASVWELAIKASLGRLTLPKSVHDYFDDKLAAGFVILPIEWVHAARVAELPFHHRDPFDRLIIAQGLVESIPIVSGDPEFKKYGARIVW